MKEKILKRIIEELKSGKDLLFTEVEDIFREEGFDYKGEQSLRHPENKNLVLWVEWNEEAIDIAMKLIEVPEIYAVQCNKIEIALYSCYLPLPIAKSDKYNYTQPHWFPIKYQWIEKKTK